MTTGIQVKNYEHYNRSFPDWDDPLKGKFVRNKSHYYQLCNQYNMIPSDVAGEIVKKKQEEFKKKRLEPSPDIKEFLRWAQDTADRKTGKIKLEGRAIDFMIKKGIIKDMDKVHKQIEKCKEGAL